MRNYWVYLALSNERHISSLEVAKDCCVKQSDCSELFHKVRDNEFQLQERKHCLDIRKYVALIIAMILQQQR